MHLKHNPLETLTMDPEMTQKMIHLFQNGMPKRAIARKLGRNVKTVRRILAKHGLTQPQGNSTPVPRERPESKLTPFLEEIDKRVTKELTGSRILREIRNLGYTGGRTILLDHIRKLRGPAQAPQRFFRRFETAPAQEAQADWSPYRVQIAGRIVLVHCFSIILCFSRYLFIQFHRDERLPSLLAAHIDAFSFFGGVTRTVVYDNMATVTLGRTGGKPLWNPKFLPFAQHYMYEPRLCRPADPNRKGKVESPFAYIEKDFLKGRTFHSWDHLHRAAQAWLRGVANRRKHGTTQLIPEEAWLSERDFLTDLPETTFPAYRQEMRTVSDDALVSVDGSRYSVPVHLIGQGRSVCVRIHPRLIEILNRNGQIIATHRKPDFPGRLVIDQDHYAAIKRTPPRSHNRTDLRFLDRFPGAEPFLKGLKARMKALYGPHLREILLLIPLYGHRPVQQAIQHASGYGNFNAYAVRRILQDRFPLISPDIPLDASVPENAFQPYIDDVETGSFDDYRQYTDQPPTEDHQTDDQQTNDDLRSDNENEKNENEKEEQ
jgi:transposase